MRTLVEPADIAAMVVCLELRRGPFRQRPGRRRRRPHRDPPHRLRPQARLRASRLEAVTDVSEMLEVASGDPDAVRDVFAERGWGDGLPMVAPTVERVDAMLARCAGDADEPVAVLPPRSGVATRRIIAVNAVLAGCRPEHLGVLVAAVRALARPEVNLRGVNATTHPVAPAAGGARRDRPNRRLQLGTRRVRPGQRRQRGHRAGPAADPAACGGRGPRRGRRLHAGRTGQVRLLRGREPRRVALGRLRSQRRGGRAVGRSRCTAERRPTTCTTWSRALPRRYSTRWPRPWPHWARTTRRSAAASSS